MKKLLIFLMLAVMLFTSACSQQNAETPDDTAAANTDAAVTDAAATEEETEPAIPAPELTKVDYTGRTFTILYLDWSMYSKYLTADELTGEVMNDALFTRTLKVEEQTGADVIFESVGTGDIVYDKTKQNVTSGDNAFDMGITHCINNMTTFVTDNLLVNWNDIPNVDFTRPYWNQSLKETLEINGYLPFAASDMLVPDINLIFYNKQLADDYGIEDLYALVREGSWTIDKMIELAETVTKDLDGDGKMSEGDQYGFYSASGWPLISFLYGFDQTVCSKNDDGIPQVDLINEKMVSAAEKMYRLCCENDTYFDLNTISSDDSHNITADFTTYPGLFYNFPLSQAEYYRDMEIEFGIIPFPKYDTAQENYISLNWTGFQSIPKTCPDREFVGVISELLAYYSSIEVIPTYFDVLLNNKVARDEDTKEMLELAFEHCVYEFGMTYSNHNELFYIIPKLIEKKTSDLVSFVEGRTKGANMQYKKIYNAYIEDSEAE